MTQTGTPPGWYPDGHGATRWFDGAAWTPQTQPAAPPVYQPATDPRSVPYQPLPGKPSHTGRNVLLGILALAVVVGIIAVAASSNKTNTSNNSAGPAGGA
ncbi:MAG: DUF2510 domain-containing protein, partial [Actinomycetota bacterium]|nr:DUF2510 domain-containing protein [Actinomycetota bacterium]